jgi:hypothetical protein
MSKRTTIFKVDSEREKIINGFSDSPVERLRFTAKPKDYSPSR